MQFINKKLSMLTKSICLPTFRFFAAKVLIYMFCLQSLHGKVVKAVKAREKRQNSPCALELPLLPALLDLRDFCNHQRTRQPNQLNQQNVSKSEHEICLTKQQHYGKVLQVLMTVFQDHVTVEQNHAPEYVQYIFSINITDLKPSPINYPTCSNVWHFLPFMNG